MPHAFIMDFSDAGVELYDAVMADMQLGGELPPGAILHAAGLSDGALKVCDVWETPEAFDAFAHSQIGPLTKKHGASGPPALRSFEVAQVREGDPGPVGLLQVVTLPGVDAATFAELDAQVLGPDRQAPAGCVYHVNGPLGEDWVVMDLWTDAEIHGRFMAERVAPAMQAGGAPAPTVELMSIHASMLPASVAA